MPQELVNKLCDPIELNNKPLPCLMYADDLVIFSKSEKGMKECLKKLQSYCNRWRLSVNIKKTKIMIINKPKSAQYTFKFNNLTIETTNEYNYLGINFNHQGNFKQAIIELSKKAQRAYFAIRKDFNFYNNTKAKTQLKLFETMVQPILLYGSEIWGLFGWRTNNQACATQYILNQKHTFETIHTKACKNILGVHKYTSDLMEKAELGRFPLISNIIQNVCSYWQHILNAKPGSLLSELHSSFTKQHGRNRTNYYTRYKILLTIINKDYLVDKLTKNEIIKEPRSAKASFNNMYEEYVFKEIKDKAIRTNSGGRFALYSQVKFTYKFENYLQLDNNLRRAITSLRLSTHNLPIEKLRKKKIERHLRICNCCKDRHVGSEIHVLMHCKNPELIRLRSTLFNKLGEYCSQWEILPVEDKFVYLLCAHDEVFNFYFAIFLDKVFKFVDRCYNK